MSILRHSVVAKLIVAATMIAMPLAFFWGNWTPPACFINWMVFA